MEEAIRCPNCGSRLGADGTCYKCWWRPPRVEQDMTGGQKALILFPPIVLAFAAAYTTYLAMTEGAALRWTFCACLWLATALSAVGAVMRMRKAKP
jgi:hypothetical protein